MASEADSPRMRWTTRLATATVAVLAVALVGAASAAVFEDNIASQYHSRLARISPCDGGGFGIYFGCPPAIGATFVQLGKGGLAQGEYVFTFLVAPVFPPIVNASDLEVRAYNSTSNATVALQSVTLSAPNGSVVAAYHDVGGT